MGVAVSSSMTSLSTRRRFSRESRGSRTSLLRGPAIIADATASERAPSLSPQQQQQLRLRDTLTSKSTLPNSDANAETNNIVVVDKERAREPSASSDQIVRDRRANSNTVNSIHSNPWNTEAQKSPLNAPIMAASSTAVEGNAPPRRPHLCTSLEINVHSAEQARMAEEAEAEELLKAEIDACLTHSTPLTAMRHGTPKLPTARALRWANMVTFDEASPTTDSDNTTPITTTVTTPGPSSFEPWGLRHASSVSSVDCTDQSKAVIATSNFKATYQRLCEEPRSRGNNTLLIKSAKNNSLDGRSSRGDRRTNSTQLSTEEWSHLLELMDEPGNTLISADDNSAQQIQQQRSESKSNVKALPKYPATDTIPEVGLGEASHRHSTPLPNVSATAEDASFTPLRMRFSTTTSLLSGPPNSDMDLQRAITAVDLYAANMRKLLISWQDILNNHFDAFALELSAAFASRYPTYNRSSTGVSAEEHARTMLQMVGQAVQLVSQMGDMYAALLEMGAMHRRHDIGPSHFEALYEAFMEVLPHYVAADERDSLCDSVWEPFWQLIVNVLTQGNATQRGEWYAAQRRAEWMADARAVFKVVAEQQQATQYRGTFIPAMLDCAEETNPAMSQFCVVREPRAAIRSFEGLALIALEIEDDAERARRVEQMAHEHIVYGLSEWGLRQLRQPFIDVCQRCVELSVHPDAWTPTAAESLGLFWDMLTEHWVEGIAVSRRSLADIRSLHAPSGSRPFCMVFTDIEAASRLWELYPTTMADAVDAHNKILRQLIADNGAYEVKVDGDSFVIATKSVFAALQIAVSAQLELMRRPIADNFRMVPVVQGGGLGSCWRSDSLRVRIGIHYCTDASAVYDSVQRRFDYYGPSVNCAARTAAAAAGGQILITQEAVNAMRDSWSEKQRRQDGDEQAEDSPMPIAEIAPGANPMDTVLDTLLEFQWWGEQRFRGISEPVRLYSVLPMRLSGRTFPYYVGSRKVRVSAPSDIEGRKEVFRLSLAQLKSGNTGESASALFRP